MVKYSEEELDSLFGALSDRTRRHVLQSLAEGERPVSELAASYDMSLPGFMKHLRVLEAAGLIERSKEGRVVSCELHAKPMQAAAAWMARYEKFWTERLDALGRFLYQQEELQRWKAPDSAKNPRSSSSATTPSRRKKSGARGPTRRR
ncbi:MAG: metalloregulator ArsR/SmtB family transcription factor [Betaproteobacteria bacterium]|nr:metalloregulator ArsR/SmtB family transcription factor [Betaproteobacteria bacterium]